MRPGHVTRKEADTRKERMSKASTTLGSQFLDSKVNPRMKPYVPQTPPETPTVPYTSPVSILLHRALAVHLLFPPPELDKLWNSARNGIELVQTYRLHLLLL